MNGKISENNFNNDLKKEELGSNLKSLDDNFVFIDIKDPVEQTKVCNDNSSQKKKHVNFFKQFLLPRVYITAIVCFIIIYGLNITYKIVFRIFFKSILFYDNDTESITNSTSSNQQSLVENVHNNDLLINKILFILTMIIFGPIFEEFIFRFCIFKPIHIWGKHVEKKNKFIGKIIVLLAFIISSGIFAFGHFEFKYSLLIEEIEFFPEYFIMGIMFACAYNYDGYFAAAILTHILNNCVATLGMI